MYSNTASTTVDLDKLLFQTHTNAQDQRYHGHEWNIDINFIENVDFLDPLVTLICRKYCNGPLCFKLISQLYLNQTTFN